MSCPPGGCQQCYMKEMCSACGELFKHAKVFIKDMAMYCNFCHFVISASDGAYRSMQDLHMTDANAALDMPMDQANGTADI